VRTSTRMTLAVGWAAGLGAIPLGAVYDDWSWLWYAWAAVLAVVAGHLAVRGTRLPTFLAPVAGAIGLLLYLTLVFAGDDALLGLIPTPGSMAALHQTLSDGLSDVQDLAAPVPADPGLVLLAAGSIGLLTIVMDVIAVIGRRPAAAGLALLGLYAVPTAVARDGIGWPLFVGGALGYLVLLMAEGKDRLLRWGRPIGAEQAPPRPGQQRTAPDDPPPAFTGQRIGAAALAVAVVLPVLVPGLTSHTLADLTRSGGGGGGGGNGKAVSISPFSDLSGYLQRPQPTKLFTASSQKKDLYNLRLMTLDRYNASGWQRTNLTDGQSAAGIVDQPMFQSVAADDSKLFQLNVLTDGAYKGDSLPTAYYASKVDGVTPDWHYDSRGAVLQNPSGRANSQRYTITGYDAVPTADQLRAATGEPPDPVKAIWGGANNIPAQVTSLVEQLTRGKTTPFDKALALTNYFLEPKNGFLYSTQTRSGNSGSQLVDFLQNKRGYCEQFASALGIMLRAAGIPSRVVIGFLHPRNDTGQWDITSNDAHAWVEAYFTGLGWAPFDATPRDYTGRITPAYAPGPGANTPSAPAGGPSVSASGGAGPSAALPDEIPFQTDTTTSQGGLVTPRTGLITLAVLVAVLLLVTPALGRRRTRRRRLRLAAGGDPYLAARSSWDELLDTGTDLAVSMPGNETPRGTARRLARELAGDPAAVAGLKLLALAEERARYAPGAGVEGDLPTATRAVRRGLRDLTGRRRRLRATLFPPSTMRAIRVGAARRSAATSTTTSRLAQELLRAFRPRRAASDPPTSP
jgi:transglutaminase-like putative cysteine protease